MKLDLLHSMTMYDTVNIDRLKVDHLDNPRITWLPLPPLVWRHFSGTNDIVKSIGNLQHSSTETSWQYEVKWEGVNAKDKACKPDEII